MKKINTYYHRQIEANLFNMCKPQNSFFKQGFLDFDNI